MVDQKDDSPVVRRVLDRIEHEKITVRSKLSVLAERLGIDSIGVLMFLIAVFALNLVLFWAKSAGFFEYFRVGPLGLRALLEEFPYQWLIIGLLALIAVTSMVKHAEENRPAPHAVLVTLLLLGVVGFGTAFAFSGLNERIAENFGPVDRLTNHRGDVGVIGIIAGVDSDGYILDVGDDTIFVRVTNSTNVPPDYQPFLGDRILVISQSASGSTIDAAAVRELPKIQRRMKTPPPMQMFDPAVPVTQS